MLSSYPLEITAKEERSSAYKNVQETVAALQHNMTFNVGIIRSDSSLRRAVTEIDRLVASLSNTTSLDILGLELRNMALLSGLVAHMALLRTESRGAHYRSDYPQISDEWQKNLVV